MPSATHEALHHVFRDDVDLISRTLHKVCGMDQKVIKAEEITNDATSIQVSERRCDTVLRLDWESQGSGILIVESQTRRDKDKETAWPQIVSHLHAKYTCPVALLVITQQENTAAWARGPFVCGFPGVSPTFVLSPFVLGPDNVLPVTDVAQALEDLPSAIVSALIHGCSPHALGILKTLEEALGFIEEKKAAHYAGLIEASLQNTREAQNLWKEIMSASSQPFVSFLEARGEARGEAKMLLLILKARGIAVTDEARERITSCTDEQQFESWAQRAQTITAVDELFA